MESPVHPRKAYWLPVPAEKIVWLTENVAVAPPSYQQSATSHEGEPRGLTTVRWDCVRKVACTVAGPVAVRLCAGAPPSDHAENRYRNPPVPCGLVTSSAWFESWGHQYVRGATTALPSTESRRPGGDVARVTWYSVANV